MNQTRVSISVMIVAIVVVTPLTLNAQTPVGTAFTYQGQLKDDGQPVTNTCDFDLRLYDAATGGGQIGSTVNTNGVDVVNGLFIVSVDFGDRRFTGDARWLEINVECSGDLGPTTLSPRQELAPTPYALALPGLWTEQKAESPNLIGGSSGNETASGVYGATIAGGGRSTYPNRVLASLGTVGGGDYNTASDWYASVGGGTGNTASDYSATVSGGYHNTASGDRATVGGGTINEASGFAAAVPGGYYCTAQGDYSFAAGRRAKANHNGAFVWADSTDAEFASTAEDQFLISAAGGVGINTNGPQATLHVAGEIKASSLIESTTNGFKFPDGTVQSTAATAPAPAWNLTGNAGTDVNTNFPGTTDDEPLELWVNNERALRIEPHSWSSHSPNLISGYSGNSTAGGHGRTIAGGGNPTGPNRVLTNYGTVGGGYANTSGFAATVAGGTTNTATGDYATVPGGYWNSATGDHSFAAGCRAQANSNGCFVWGDSTYVDVTCDVEDRWVARAGGGVYFYTDSGLTSGVYVAAGGTSWNAISDRAIKEDFRPVDRRAILDTLAGLPVWEYRLKSQDGSIRHVGPVAQDFAAFGYGESDKAINMEDAHGVALAAIQGLYEIVQEKDAEIAAQKEQIAELTARLERIEAMLAESAGTKKGGTR